jgi:mannose-6-phosphate isomerase-like protein (cupin superfamily)
MPEDPVIVDAAAHAWATWPHDQRAERGAVLWKTLIDGETTNSDALTMGLARLPPGTALHEHHHAQAEVYLLLEGSAVVSIDGVQREIVAGAAVFIPGGARHSCRNPGPAEARFAYVLAADSFADVEYVFAP